MSEARDTTAPATDGRDTRWAGHRKVRRDLLLATAIELIDRDGPGVGVAAIATEAGIPRSVVYKLFDDRDHLDEQIRRRIIAGVTAELTPYLVPHGTLRETVRSAAATYIGWVGAHPNLQRFVGSGSGGSASAPKSQAGRSGKDAFARRVEQAVEVLLPGLLPGVTPPPGLSAHLAFGLVGLTDNVVNQLLYAGAATPQDGLAAFVADAACAVIEATVASLGAELDLDTPLDLAL